MENISAENLNMSEEEFNANMGYVDGKTDVDLLIEEEEQEQQAREKLHVLKVRGIEPVHRIGLQLYSIVLLSRNEGIE